YPRPDFGPFRTRSTFSHTPAARANSSSTTSPPRLVSRSGLLSSLMGRINCGKLGSIVHPPGDGVWSSSKTSITHIPWRVFLFWAGQPACQSRSLGESEVRSQKLEHLGSSWPSHLAELARASPARRCCSDF